nr:MAG TPA_asm: hypothetical protein [Caudoviricetes sp.]
MPTGAYGLPLLPSRMAQTRLILLFSRTRVP